MALIETRPGPARAAVARQRPLAQAWTRRDTLLALAWMAAALGVRSLFAARIEGMLDHDQGVVGLMALDIAAGRRWPMFFDGQRYMGALEAYTAALFVKLLGHSPAVVALAPALYFGLFAGGQFAVWRCWAGRSTGHWAALVTTVGSPMLGLWGVAPRGGYSELLAWAVPVLAVYRAVTQPGSGPRGWRGQLGWGLLLAFGFFLNPLSLIVYTTLAIDWLLGRHGAELRRQRRLDGRWVDGPAPLLGWAVIAAACLSLLAVGCHVALDATRNEMEYVWLLGLVPRHIGLPLGASIVAAVLGSALWWTGLAQRVYRLLSAHLWFAVGVVTALVPFLVYNVQVMLGIVPRGLSLPIWIRAPWDVAPNVRDGLFALRPLVGCDPHAAAYSVVGQFLKVPPPRWPGLEHALVSLTPGVVLLVAALVVTVAWRDRLAWQSFWGLRGRAPTPPTVLALMGVCVSLGLYLLQATSANSTSIRYLLPVWIFLPGLVAEGLRTWPRGCRVAAASVLLSTWLAAQALLWTDMAQPSPMRPVAEELERRGATGIVASTHIVLLGGDLTQGRIGGLEYHSYWPRLHTRFADRLKPGQPIICVNDLEYGRPPIENLGLRLHELAARHPGRIRKLWQHGPYEIWEADVPLAEIMDLGPCAPGDDRRRWRG